MSFTVNDPDLVSSLREANQCLVIATLKAQELREEAEASNARQKEFLYMLAHELRNPLAPLTMVGYLLDKVAKEYPEDAQLPKIRAIVHRQVSHMAKLIENLLEASRVHSGKITLHQKPLELAEVLRNAVESCQMVMDQRSQTVELDLPGAPVTVDGDEVRLAQVFTNLLVNAIKFSQNGDNFVIRLRTEGPNAVVSIIDHGVGIDPAEQTHIFDLFTQSSRSLERSEGGLGIGLSLVRALTELHGGTAKVISAGHGKGCEFVISLPLASEHQAASGELQNPAVATEPQSPAQLEESKVCTVVVIEDNVDANEILRSCLELEGHRVSCAFDGLSGLAMAQHLQPDIVVCDIGLPGLDGFEVVTELRQQQQQHQQQKQPHGRPCCIAVTGYHQEDYKARAMQAGFDHYLVKPVEMDTLIALIHTTCLTALAPDSVALAASPESFST